jgi:hypothetical protein
LPGISAGPLVCVVMRVDARNRGLTRARLAHGTTLADAMVALRTPAYGLA